MASMDLDPVFSKCLRLLHSKSKDSEEQLRHMLEEAIRQRSGSSKSISLLQKKESSTKKDNIKPSTSSSSGRKDDFRKEDKHSYMDKAIDDILDDNQEEKGKRNKAAPILKLGQSSNPNSPHSMLSDMEPIKEDSLTADDDDDDLALEILEEDLTCVVCRGMDVGVRNQLVECLECHSLYHQECHQPPVSEDMNDPRSAWYCASCSKALNKIPSKTSSHSAPKPTSSSNSSGREREMPPVAPKAPLKTDSTQLHAHSLFKKSDNKGGSSSLTGNSINKWVAATNTGLAAFSTSTKPSSGKNSFLPKVFGGIPTTFSASTSKSLASFTNASKAVVPKINIISADKRLAIMKKKAAKLQEKRKLSK